MKKFHLEVVKLLHPIVVKISGFDPLSKCSRIFISKASSSFGTMPKFCFISSMSYCNNQIFSINYCNSNCYFYVFSVSILFWLSNRSTFTFATLSCFSIKLKDCLTTFRLTYSCSRVYFKITCFESMEPKVLPISISHLQNNFTSPQMHQKIGIFQNSIKHFKSPSAPKRRRRKKMHKFHKTFCQRP